MPIALAGLACGALVFGATAQPTPRLVWNASASVPTGLYRVTPVAGVSRGDLVVASLPARVRELADSRGYLPAPIPLVKPVVATAGDRVCASGSSVTVNARRVATRYRADAAGRLLPQWQGCRTLRSDEVFLLAPPAGSFDGRYFGVSRGVDVIGRAMLVWRS